MKYVDQYDVTIVLRQLLICDENMERQRIMQEVGRVPLFEEAEDRVSQFLQINQIHVNNRADIELRNQHLKFECELVDLVPVKKLSQSRELSYLLSLTKNLPER